MKLRRFLLVPEHHALKECTVYDSTTQHFLNQTLDGNEWPNPSILILYEVGWDSDWTGCGGKE
jgi:hypothetical protein